MVLKTSILALVLTSLLLGLWVAPALAGHRIQDNGEGTVSLESRSGNVPEQAGGTAEFKLDRTTEGVSRMTVRLRIRSLPRRAGRLYEAWLVDFDGSNVNLTAFNTNSNGRDVTTVTRNIVNMAPYDRIVVTTKRKNSLDTSPSGTTVLSGRLH